MEASETGHTQNATNLETLISALTSFDKTYQPSRNELQLSSLEILLNDARLAMKEVAGDTAALTDAVTARELAFEDLRALAARIGNVLEVSSVDPLISADARIIIRKLQGGGAAHKPVASVAGKKGASRTSVVALMSFESRIANFEELIHLLESQTSYAPKEADLKPDALLARLSDMKEKNSAALSAAASLGGSRMVRNEVLYDEESGLVTIANLVKKHVKSAFGADSPQFKKIKDLKFTNES